MIPDPRGDDGWLRAWMTQHGDALMRMARAYVRDEAAAQDIVQETFLRLYYQHKRAPQRTLTAGWLFTVARHLALDAVRQTRRRPTLGLTEAELVHWDADALPRLDLEQALDRLRQPDRELLLLLYFEEWSIQELADHYRLSPQAVKSRLFRARRQLKRLYHSGGDSHGDR